MKSDILGLGLAVVVLGLLWRLIVTDFPPRWQKRLDAIEIVILAVLVLEVIRVAYVNVTMPIAWDFPVFYTAARNAVDGVSFYDPDALASTFSVIQREANVPSDWLQEFGFWYAPPTALILVPVGVSSFTTGLVTQYILQGSLFAGSIYLLHRFYPLRPNAMGLIDMAILGLAFRPVLSAFGLAQIVFGALFMLVVATRTIRDRPWSSGFALGIGALFKHLLLIPAVLVLAIRKWKVAGGALAAVTMSTLLAGLVFGFGVYKEFITFGPSDRSPEIALDPVIESLNAVLRRAFDAVPSGPGAFESILYPPYLVSAAVLTLATIVIVWRAQDRLGSTILAFSLISVLSLIVYPNTLFNTLPLLIPALVVILHKVDDLPFSRPVTVSVVAAQYFIVATRALPAFLALAATWSYLAICMVAMIARKSNKEIRTPAPQTTPEQQPTS